MKPSTKSKTQRFTLSGKVVGFVKDGRKLKGIKVKVGGIKYRVKLAKPLRNSLPPELSKGQPVHILGDAKQKKGGELQLKAADLQVLPNAPDAPFLDLAPDAPPVEPAVAVPQAPASKAQTKILICQKGSCWKKRNGQAVCEQLQQRLSDRGLEEAVTIKKTGCMDRCKSGPNLVVMPGKTRYSHVGMADVDELIDQHIAPHTQT